MKKYTEKDITIIEQEINSLSQKIYDSLAWSEHNLKYEERTATETNLKYNLNILDNIKQNIHEKPAIALFGGSQVGKSYLIKNLLSEDGNSFSIENGGVDYDFLQQINPSGNGAESTGVVTRFTVDETKKFADFPIKVNLLSAKDILLILMDTFFLDQKKISTYRTKGELDNFVSNWEGKNVNKHSNSYLSEYDIIEVKKYFESYLSKHSLLLENFKEINFFERIGKIICNFNSTEWVEIFSVLWHDDENMNILFSQLILSLESLQFQKSIYIPFDEVLRGAGEIIDVERLNEFYISQDLLNVKLQDGDIKIIKRSHLSALIAELIFTIPKDVAESKKFLQNSDLLDFPGARSRLFTEQNKLTQDLIPKMLLRGKVSYLFNKYTDEYKINSLLFCTNDQQLNVNEIPYLLYNWIEKNIGNSPIDRSKTLKDSKISQLFIVFTFLNNQLEFDSTNDINYLNDFNSLNYKWDTRFNRFFEGELVTSSRDWHVNWTTESPIFKNLYLLRDFKYSADTHIGFETNGLELEINPIRKQYLETLKESFKEHPFVKTHFENAASAWSSAVDVNNDGSKPIVENLEFVSNNNLKTNHYLSILNSLVNDIALDLSKFIKSNDLDDVRKSNMRMIADVQFSFNELMAQNVSNFNYFIKKLSVKPVLIYNVINQNIVNDSIVELNDNFSNIEILKNQFPEIKNHSTRGELVEFLKKKLWLSSEEEVLDYLTKYNVDLSMIYQHKTEISKAKFLIESCLKFWVENISDYDSYDVNFKKTIPRTQIEFIVNHFHVIIKSRKFDEKLTVITESIMSESLVNRGIEEFIAETFSILINELANNFDLNYFSKEETGELEKLGFTLENEIFQSVDDNILNSIFSSGDLAKTENNVALKNYVRWIENFRMSLLANSGFVDFDEHQNDKLKSIIAELSTINFS